MQMINGYPTKFSVDYEANKKVLSDLAIFRVKGLRNEVVGYITRYYKMREAEAQPQDEEEPQVAEETEAPAPS